MRKFTVLKEGKVHTRGTFDDEAMLLLDYPAPKFSIVYDNHLNFEVPEPTYADNRRMAYPNMGDQLDTLWRVLSNTTAFKNDPEAQALHGKILAVKQRFPK